MNHLLKCENLTYKYCHNLVLNGVSFTIDKPSLTAIVGPNGAGKSTLLKLLSGHIKPVSGSILFKNSSISYLPQQRILDRSFPLKVLDVACMGLYREVKLFNQFNERQMQKVNNALTITNMINCANDSLHSLSGGQLQRLLFARMMLQDAQNLLLDEPFAAIDEETTVQLMNILLVEKEKGKNIIVVLHSNDLVKKYFDNVIILSNGFTKYGSASTVLS